MAKLTPSPAIVAPRGYERPGVTFLRVLCSSGMRPSPDYQPPCRRGPVETRESTSVVDLEDLGLLRPPSALRRRRGGFLQSCTSPDVENTPRNRRTSSGDSENPRCSGAISSDPLCSAFMSPFVE